jgi:Flp pilus assembly protein TadD
MAPGHAYAMKGLGLCLARQGRVDDGVCSLEQAITASPTWYDPYWDLAVVLHEAGRDAQAALVLKRGMVAVPSQRAAFESFLKKLLG